MVVKTFRCDEHGEMDIEMPMDQVTADCPDCGKRMERVYNMEVRRPARGPGFFGRGDAS